jgi:hypothetical protein
MPTTQSSQFSSTISANPAPTSKSEAGSGTLPKMVVQSSESVTLGTINASLVGLTKMSESADVILNTENV